MGTRPVPILLRLLSLQLPPPLQQTRMRSRLSLPPRSSHQSNHQSNHRPRSSHRLKHRLVHRVSESFSLSSRPRYLMFRYDIGLRVLSSMSFVVSFCMLPFSAILSPNGINLLHSRVAWFLLFAILLFQSIYFVLVQIFLYFHFITSSSYHSVP